MPFLCEAMDRTTAFLFQAGDALDQIFGTLRKRLPAWQMEQPYDALFKSALWLLATVWIERWSGHAPTVQLLYLVPVWLTFETAGLGAAACIALAVIPISAFFSLHPSWGFGWDMIVRAGLMGSLIAIMTYHGRRYSDTRESAQRDALTGALNRAGFEETAKAEIDTSLASRGTLTVTVIDCDNFKDLNDLKGHAFGDQVLRTLVRTLNNALVGAVIGRTGGDEFVILDAERNAAEVRRALSHALDHFTDATLVMGRRSTFTAGIAQLGPDGLRYEALLEAADRDMYRGKFARYNTLVA